MPCWSGISAPAASAWVSCAASASSASALAWTIAHDAHNVAVVGMSDDDMRVAVERLAERGGGIVAVDHGLVRASPPPIAAPPFSTSSLEEVIAGSRARATRLRTTSAAASTCSTRPSSRSVISTKLTDRGLVDVDAFGTARPQV